MVPSYSKFKTFCEENNLPPEKEDELILIAAAIVREENERAYAYMQREVSNGLRKKSKRLKNL